jgi:3-dehydroquinate dehydratase / shikimate dehydrogenase
MKLFVTIHEETPEGALQAIRLIDGDHDGVEIRAERFGVFDAGAFRTATTKPLILTRRGVPFDAAILRDALTAGIDYVDIEYSDHLDKDFIERHRDRIVLSHHDFAGMPDVESLVSSMCASGCAHVKLAVTPKTFSDNERLLRILSPAGDRPAVTTIGMGERGLYSRILAPFKGSALFFASRSDDRSAAPGQLPLDRALGIYGSRRASLRAERVFAVTGNKAGSSVSPPLHNELFRRKGVAAAYTVASIETFGEITGAFLRGEPCGLSVTVPFKVDAYRFAGEVGAQIGENARACEAVNTLVNLKTIVADNTDVDGFASILAQVCGRDRKSVALVGAGGTARAAMVAVARANMHVTVFNRTASKGEALASRFGAKSEPLEQLKRFDGEIVINTTTPEAEIGVPSHAGLTYIESAYGAPAVANRHARLRENGVQVFDGLDLLQAQLVRQHELFMRVFA